ncbi:MAG: YibE/F family protein, partial [Patescibacteria group bacterium]
MRRKFLILSAVASVFFLAASAGPVSAQSDEPDIAAPTAAELQPLRPDAFVKAVVEKIVGESQKEIAGIRQKSQILEMRLLDGADKGKTVSIENADSVEAFRPAKVGDTYVVTRMPVGDASQYFIYDNYRLNRLTVIFGIFFVIVFILGRKKGIASMVGLAVSIAVLEKYIVPGILHGGNPLTVTLLGSLAIMVVAMYLGHGVNMRTTIAFISTVMALGVSYLFADVFVGYARLFGAGSEAAFYLQYEPGFAVNLRGLLLGGIIIGTLGVLADVTTAQVASVEEI